MTHANHRQGNYDNLSNDFVALAFTRETEVPAEKRQQWSDICLCHDPVHLNPRRWQHYVFDRKEKVTALLKDLVAADLGLSITISGLFDQVWDCCKKADIAPHSVNYSLGFLGRTEKLPHSRILEFTSMCGHEKVSSNLVWYLADRVREDSLSIEAAVDEMSRPCLCDLFNNVRASVLLRQLVADLKEGKLLKPQPTLKHQVTEKTWGMRIDAQKCIRCLLCLPYCPMSAIIEMRGAGVVAIDPEECVECGTCFRVVPCPTDAIVPGELEWPHTIRMDLSDPHVPDQSPILTGSKSSSTADRSSLFSRPLTNRLGRDHEVKTNDVTGRYAPGFAGIRVELGRPVLGTKLREVEKVTRLFSSLKLTPEKGPVRTLMIDLSTGKLRDDVLNEKVNRCAVEVMVPLERVPLVLQQLRDVAGEVDTVFVINLISTISKDGSVPVLAALKKTGMKVSINGKTNVGLGRPLKTFL
jgi:ferredoxin